MSSRILYQVGFIGTASGRFRKTAPVARVCGRDSEDRCKVYSTVSNEQLGYVECIPEGYAAYAIDSERGDGMYWQKTAENMSAALREVMGRPGYGYDHYSFRG